MKLNPYKSSSHRLLVPCTLLIFLLLTFQSRAKTIVGSDKQSVAVTSELTVIANPERPAEPPTNQLVTSLPQIRIPIGKTSRKDQDSNIGEVLSKLSQLGPVFPTAAYSMSDFAVQGFVKGNWPIVIVYELEADSTAAVTISSGDGKLKFPILLKPTNGERREVKEYLPAAFAEKPQVGLVSFKAFKNGSEPRKPARFFLYGLGVGDKAVGSMVLVQLQFKPTSIRPKLKEKASYSFHSLSDFNSVTVDFNLATIAADGSTYPQLAYRREFKNGVRTGQTVEGDWDGKDSKGKISVGPHQFHVRAWRGLKSGADWAFAAEQILVKVEKE